MNSESILVSCYYRRQSVTSYSTHMSYTHLNKVLRQLTNNILCLRHFSPDH